MSEIKTDKISPQSGTAFTLGDSGDTFTIPSGANIVNSGTATGFGGGKVLQYATSIVSSTGSSTTQIMLDTSIPQNTEGTEVTTLTFTPESATSTLYINCVVFGGRSNTDMYSVILCVDSTANALAIGGQQGSTNPYTFGLEHVEASASTSARTYKLRYGPSSGGAGTAYLNQYTTALFGGIARSGIMITEYEA